MTTKLSDKSITQIFGSVAAAQTMVEQFPFSFGMSESGFTCSFDLLAALFNLCSDKPLDEMLIQIMTDKLSDPNSTWLQGIEETVKLVLETNLTSILTCELSPIIPDKLIGGGEFLKGSDKQINFSGEGVIIPLSSLDFTGMLGICPADDSAVAKSNYMGCYDDDGQPLSVKDLWKHDDFNAFLWYVKNKGVYSNLTERNKLMWDNRYKTKPYTKYERKPESFFTKKKGMKSGNYEIYSGPDGLIPFDGTYLSVYNDNAVYKKRQIMEVRYLDGDNTMSDSFQFRLAASNYYKTRKLTGKKQRTENKKSEITNINKTIFEFNHDFLMSIKLYDAKTYLSQIVSNLFGQGNFSFNFSITRESELLNEVLDTLIENVINLDDIEVNDCHFNFSNDEYDTMLQNAIKRRRNAELNTETVNELMTIIDSIDKVVGEEAPDTKTPIESVLSGVTSRITDPQTSQNTSNGWKLNYDVKFELIRMLVYPLVRPLFTPKIMTIILLNTSIMGNPLELGKKIVTFEDVLPYFMNILTGVIKSIKDMIVEMLYSWVIEKLTPLLTIFSLRLVMEQLEAYRKLIEDMLTACIGAYKQFRGNGLGGGIGDVKYVDIDPELEKLKQTPISNTNC